MESKALALGMQVKAEALNSNVHLLLLFCNDSGQPQGIAPTYEYFTSLPYEYCFLMNV